MENDEISPEELAKIRILDQPPEFYFQEKKKPEISLAPGDDEQVLPTSGYKLSPRLTLQAQEGYKRVVQDAKRHVRNDNDLVVAITGREGSGKSKFSIRFSHDLERAFNMERQVLFKPTPKQAKETLFSIPKYGVEMVDEATDVLYKRQAMGGSNIGLVQFFAKVRKFNRIVILVLPSFTDLDPFFRKRRVSLRISVIARGLGAAFVARDIEGIEDPWFTDFNKKLAEDYVARRGASAGQDPLSKLALYQTYRGYYCPITWSDDCIPAEEWARYSVLAKEANGRQETESAAIAAPKLGLNGETYRACFGAITKRYMADTGANPGQVHRIIQNLLGADLISEATIAKLASGVEKVRPEKKEAKKIILADLAAAYEEPDALGGAKKGDDAPLVEDALKSEHIEV